VSAISLGAEIPRPDRLGTELSPIGQKPIEHFRGLGLGGVA
jgi:hypothetical protein